jgi:hypothetical protein
MIGSNQYGIAHGIRDEENAAQQKRIQEDRPERSISLHDVAQIGSVDLKECAGFKSSGADQSAAAREQVYVAGKFSTAENMENSLAVGRNTNQFDPAA